LIESEKAQARASLAQATNLDYRSAPATLVRARRRIDSAPVRYRVALDGSAGPDIDLEAEPKCDDVVELPGRVLARVYKVVDGADGSRVINASRVSQVGEARFE
jgi:hypothetical protein